MMDGLEGDISMSTSSAQHRWRWPEWRSQFLAWKHFGFWKYNDEHRQTFLQRFLWTLIFLHASASQSECHCHHSASIAATATADAATRQHKSAGMCVSTIAYLHHESVKAKSLSIYESCQVTFNGLKWRQLDILKRPYMFSPGNWVSSTL